MRVECEPSWHHKHLVANNLLWSLLFFFLEKQASKSLNCLNNPFKYRNKSLAGRLPGVEWKLHHVAIFSLSVETCLDFHCAMILFIINHNALLDVNIYIYSHTHLFSLRSVSLSPKCLKNNGSFTWLNSYVSSGTDYRHLFLCIFFPLLLRGGEHNLDNIVRFFHVTVA